MTGVIDYGQRAWLKWRAWFSAPFGNRVMRHALWMVACLYAAVYIAGAVFGVVGFDAHAYWDAWRHGLYHTGGPGEPNAYLYSPAFAQAIWPLTRLPWPAFYSLWTAILVSAYAWLVAPLGRRWAVPLMILLIPEIIFGNVYALYALVLVWGIRYPAVWAFPFLTKITPAVGIPWFALRRDWSRLTVAVAASMALTAVSIFISPHLLAEWLKSLFVQRSFALKSVDASQAFVVPAIVRLPIALGLIVSAARRNKYVLLAPAMVLASPVFGLNTLAILTCIPRLRVQELAAEDGFGVEPAFDLESALGVEHGEALAATLAFEPALAAEATLAADPPLRDQPAPHR
jgi:hypothetical protein